MRQQSLLINVVDTISLTSRLPSLLTQQLESLPNRLLVKAEPLFGRRDRGQWLMLSLRQHHIWKFLSRQAWQQREKEVKRLTNNCDRSLTCWPVWGKKKNSDLGFSKYSSSMDTWWSLLLWSEIILSAKLAQKTSSDKNFAACALLEKLPCFPVSGVPFFLPAILSNSLNLLSPPLISLKESDPTSFYPFVPVQHKDPRAFQV